MFSLDFLHMHLKPINESKLFMGIIMLMLNLGAKYIEIGLSKTQEQALRNSLGREIFIFAIAFTGTHDIIISILVTAAFSILADVFLHENSKYCIMSDKMQEIKQLIDTNKDGIVSAEEEQAALDILKRAETQKKTRLNTNFVSYMDSANI
jgi:uncharacterized membrane protein (DUF106 family)